MPRIFIFAGWVFPFFGAAMVLRGAHVLFITAGCVAGCTFRCLASNVWSRIEEDRKVRDVNRKLVARLHELSESGGQFCAAEATSRESLF